MPWAATGPAPTLVGRREERRQLLAALAGAAGGRPTCVVVHGEAGVGKTRLVRDVATEVATTLGAEVLWGTCVPFGSSMLPFAPLVSALQDVFPEPPEPGQGVSFLRLVDTSVSRIVALRPTVLVVDDLQWADQSSLDALAYLIAGFRYQRLALVATRRDEPLPAGHPLYGWLADMRRMPGFAELALHRLDLEETAELVASLQGGGADLEIGAQVYARSNGNPYLTELLVADLPPGTHELPSTAPRRLCEALIATWHRLDPVAREVARIVAVGGRPADVQLLAAVGASLGLGALPVAEALEAPESRSVLLTDSQGLVWFRHPLLAEILEAETPATRVSALHAAFAEVLSARPDAAPSDLAAHYAGCGAVDDAFTWSLTAAGAAEATHASAESAAQLTRACALWPQVSPGRRGSNRDRIEVLAWAAEANRRLGEEATARRLVDEALELVDEAADPLLRSRLVGQWCAVRWGHPDEGEAVLEQRQVALRLTDDQPDSAERTFALSALSEAELRGGDIASAQRHARAAMELARRSGSDVELAHALAAEALALPYPLDRRARHLEELVRAAYASEDIEAIRLAASRLGDYYNGRGDLLETARVLERAFVETKRLGERHTCYLLAEAAADSLLEAGKFEAAQALLQEALVSRSHTPAGALSRLVAAKLATRVGDLRVARALVDRALEVLEPTCGYFQEEILTPPADLLAAEGDLEGAADWIRGQLRSSGSGPPRLAGMWRAPRAGQPWPVPAEPYQQELYDRGDATAFGAVARALADLARRARDTGEPAAARRFVAELAEWHHAYRERLPGLADPAVPPTDPDLLVARAEMSRCGDDADQADWWGRAVDRCHERGFRWNEARALLRLAEAQLAGGRAHPEVAVTLRRLHALVTSMGARLLQSQTETLAGMARIRLDAPRTPPAPCGASGRHSPLDVLTAREREVLGYLVAGRTNSEIATSLVISEKTASVHVTNILRKSATTSRVEAAAWATRLGWPA